MSLNFGTFGPFQSIGAYFENDSLASDEIGFALGLNVGN